MIAPLATGAKTSALGNNPIGFYGDYAAEGALVFQTFGHFDPTGATTAANDALIRLDLNTGATTLILESADEAFTLGGVACDPACGLCFVADAKRNGGVVHRFLSGAAGKLTDDVAIKVETNPGVPPQYLGKL